MENELLLENIEAFYFDSRPRREKNNFNFNLISLFRAKYVECARTAGVSFNSSLWMNGESEWRQNDKHNSSGSRDRIETKQMKIERKTNVTK